MAVNKTAVVDLVIYYMKYLTVLREESSLQAVLESLYIIELVEHFCDDCCGSRTSTIILVIPSCIVPSGLVLF